MIKLQTKSSKDLKSSPSTLVVIVRSNGKKIEAVGATPEVAELINFLTADGVPFTDLKKGIFFRGVGSEMYQNVLVVGIDEKFKTLEDVRRVAGTICSQLKVNKIQSCAVVFEGLIKGFKSIGDVARAFTEGAQLAVYEFDEYKTKKINKNDSNSSEAENFKVEFIDLIVSKKINNSSLVTALAEGNTMADCVNFARNLGNTPGNLMTPDLLAKATVQAAKGTKLKVTVWDKVRIKKEKFGGLLGVSLGSSAEPRFIVMEYNGAPKARKPVCFVGKGLTFDSGGISIKPSSGMEEMKFDKCGGTNVIGTMLAIARLKLKINAIGLVPATENMPGPLANKPGDILVARNGKTVEVDNTDAEGRLILMDALSYASELKPAAIFDAATLTGACVVALGNSYTGVFTRNKTIRKAIDDAADIAGEAVWQMPICDDHLSDMKGTYADLNNISSFRGAGASTAAAFLEQFVDKDIPWAHFDIAGTAWHIGSRVNYHPRKGASGVMIRTFVELAKAYG